jgi:hypothetical protein
MEPYMKPHWAAGRAFDRAPAANPRKHLLVLVPLLTAVAVMTFGWLYPSPVSAAVLGLAMIVAAARALARPTVRPATAAPCVIDASPRRELVAGRGPGDPELDLADESPTSRSIVRIVSTEGLDGPPGRREPVWNVPRLWVFAAGAGTMVLVLRHMIPPAWTAAALAAIATAVASALSGKPTARHDSHPRPTPAVMKESNAFPYTIDRTPGMKEEYDACAEGAETNRRRM